MNIYVDDLRIIPQNFIGVRNYTEAIKLLTDNKEDIDILSLDHDIASFINGKEYTGYDICLYLCEFGISPKKIYIHTDNPVGRDNIYSVLIRAKERGFINSSIYKYPLVPNKY